MLTGQFELQHYNVDGIAKRGLALPPSTTSIIQCSVPKEGNQMKEDLNSVYLLLNDADAFYYWTEPQQLIRIPIAYPIIFATHIRPPNEGLFFLVATDECINTDWSGATVTTFSIGIIFFLFLETRKLLYWLYDSSGPHECSSLQEMLEFQ